MLVVDNGDAIRGIAAAAGQLDYIINGYVETTATQLADGRIGNTEGDLYLSSANATVVTSITVTNIDSVARTFTLYLKPSGGTSRAISPASLDLGIGYTFYTDGQRMVTMDALGNILQSFSLLAAGVTATAAELNKLDGGLQALVWQGTQTLNGQVFDAGADDLEINTTGTVKGLKLSSSSSAQGARILFNHDHTTPTLNSQVGSMRFMGYDGNGTPAPMVWADFLVEYANIGDGTEEVRYEWTGVTGGVVGNLAMTLSGAGNQWIDGYHEVHEISAPGAGAADTARIYAVVNGGLTNLAAVFQDGTVDVFAQETTPLDSPIFNQPSGVEVKRKMIKPHPGIIQFVEEYPDGKTFVTRTIEYHDKEKIAANKGCDSPLPKGWEVTTLQERVDKQVGMIDSQLDSLTGNENWIMAEATELLDIIDTAKPTNDKEKEVLASLKDRLDNIPSEIEQINQQRKELNDKRELELARLK